MNTVENSWIKRLNPTQNFNYIFTSSCSLFGTMVKFTSKDWELISTTTNSHFCHLANGFKFNFYCFTIICYYRLTTACFHFILNIVISRLSFFVFFKGLRQFLIIFRKPMNKICNFWEHFTLHFGICICMRFTAHNW